MCELVQLNWRRMAGNSQGGDGQANENGAGLRHRPLSVGDPRLLREWAEDQLIELGESGRKTVDAFGLYALLGLCAFWSGDFAALDEMLEITSELVGPGPWSDEVAARVILQRSLSAVLASLRGQREEAENQFAAALALSGGQAVDEARVVAYSMRAALASDGLPERALEDVQRARELSSALGKQELAAVAAIGEGWAHGELGQLDQAAQVLQAASAEVPGNLERSVAQLRLAEVQLRMGDRATARATVDAARETLLEAEARYWGARAVLLTGAIDRDRGGRWLKLARELSLPDPAYDRLFLPEGSLTIDVSSAASVLRDGAPIEFLTRHAEAAVRLLAMSRSNGMSAQELSDVFWPGIPEERQRARLRTLLWQARNSLGADAWRVQRQGNIVVLDTSGVDVFGSITAASLAKEFSARRSSSR
jgi:tetratricopeptide (TPR) repeat protein